jgi:hypothetical protein
VRWHILEQEFNKTTPIWKIGAIINFHEYSWMVTFRPTFFFFLCFRVF